MSARAVPSKITSATHRCTSHPPRRPRDPCREKVQLLQGTAKAAGPDPEVPRPYVGRVPGIERLKIPDLNMNDGPCAARASLCVQGRYARSVCSRLLSYVWAEKDFVAAGRSVRQARQRNSRLGLLWHTRGIQRCSASGALRWVKSSRARARTFNLAQA